MHYTVTLALIISLITTFMLGVLLTEAMFSHGLAYFAALKEQSTMQESQAAEQTPMNQVTAIFSTIIDTNDVGSNSIYVGIDGLPVISFYSVEIIGGNGFSYFPSLWQRVKQWFIPRSNAQVSIDFPTFDALHSLKVAKCSDSSCQNVTIHTIDSALNTPVGEYNSVVVGKDRLPTISYYDRTSSALKVAKCTDASCTASKITVVDEGEDVGLYTSIALDANMLPVITYISGPAGGINLARCKDSACATSAITTVYNGGQPGFFHSVAVGSDNLPVVHYKDRADNTLVLAKCTTVDCTAFIRSVIDTVDPYNFSASVVEDARNIPTLVYHNYNDQTLIVVRCADTQCTRFEKNAIDVVGRGNTNAVTLGADQNPIISYTVLNSAGAADLYLAKCRNASCKSFDKTRIASKENINIGEYNDVAIGTDAKPVISFTEGDSVLKTAKCTTASCHR